LNLNFFKAVSLYTKYTFSLYHRYHDVRSKDPTRENFLKRLQTYDVFNWSGKPVDPPQCALFGWEIAEKDVLKCVMCHQFLSVTLPSPTKDASCNEPVE
jgi:hypothetical protein